MLMLLTEKKLKVGILIAPSFSSNYWGKNGIKITEKGICLVLKIKEEVDLYRGTQVLLINERGQIGEGCIFPVGWGVVKC